MGTDLQSITDGTRGAGMAHSGLGSIPGPGVTCGLSLLLVFPQALRFSSLHKNQHSKFQFDLDSVEKKGHLLACPLLNSIYYLFIIYCWLVEKVVEFLVPITELGKAKPTQIIFSTQFKISQQLLLSLLQL